MYFYDITAILPAFVEKVNKEKGKRPKPKLFTFYSGGQILLTKPGLKVKLDDVGY